MKLTTKFLYLNVFLVAIALVTATSSFLVGVRRGAEEWALREQEEHLATFWKLLQSRGNTFRTVDDRLLLGDTPLNGRNDLPDAVTQIFDGTATIFLGDRRIATNVLNRDGSRAIGTALSGPVRERLFKEGKGYRGEALVLGVPYLTAYDPIRSADGKVIGALYVGTPKSAYLAVYHRFRTQVAIFAGVLIVLFSCAAFLIMRLRNKREEEVSENEQKFRRLFELQSDAIIMADTETGRIVEANQTASQLYGYGREALVGKELKELQAERGAHVPLGETAQCRHRRKDGTLFPVEIRTSRLMWHGRQLAIAAIRDVTERKRAEDELRESKERLAIAVDLSQLVQWEYDAATAHFRFDDDFYTLYGTSAQREGGYLVPTDLFLRRFIPPEEAPLVAAEIDRALAGGNPHGTSQLEHTIVRQDGERRWLVVRYRVACDGGGKVTRIYGASQDITDFKKAELAIRESNQLFRSAFEVIPDYVSISTFEEGIFVDVNPGFSRITGFGRDEAIGRSALELGLWADPGERRALLEVLKEKGFVDGMEGTFRRKDGRLITVSMSAGQVQLHGRSFLFGVIKDITERKRAEEAMSHLNRTLRTLTKCSEALVRAENEPQLLNDVCRLIVTEGGYRFAWVAYGEADPERGVRPVAHAGEAPGYLESVDIAWGDCDRGRGPVGSAIRTGKPCYIKDSRLDPSFSPWRDRAEAQGFRSMVAVPLPGATQRGSLNIYASEPGVFDEEEVELMVQLATDLAYGIGALRTRIGHQEASEALRAKAEEYRALAATRDQERTLLRALLDSIPDLIFFKDHSSTYLGCNKAFEDFAGRKERDLAGLTDYHLFPAEVADLFREMDRQMMAQRQARRNEEWVDYPDGRRVLLETLKTPFYDQEGAVRGLIGISRDITERHRAEEERVNLETQLHQAQKMEAVGQLAGGIAHDFNNILTAIMGYSDILASRLEQGSTLRSYAEQVQLATGRAAELTARLLAFSRKQVLRTKPVELRQVVLDFKKMLARIIPEDIDFSVRLGEHDLVVMADRGQLEQVLMNLVTNAKDAMPHGGRLLVAEYPATLDQRFIQEHGFGKEGSYACLSVADTGVGMDEETRNRIFEPFFTTKELGKGTGLGMAITYGIVKQHNGFIEVDSQPNVGTTFRIYLPLMMEKGEVAESRAEEPAPAGGREGVLLAEDDGAVRRLHRMILEEAGYRVVEAVDGQDALEKFLAGSEEFDLLATDVVMPKLDGKSLYEEIRKVRPEMAALFMSGYTNDIVIRKGVVQGDFVLLNKPFPPGELLKKVRAILDEKGEKRVAP